MKTVFIIFLLVAPATAILADLLEKLWPEQKYVFDGVARIPYFDLLNGKTHIDPILLESMKKYGFFFVVDVPGYSASLEHDYMKQFYDLGEEIKNKFAVRRYNQLNKNVYRGYCPGQDEAANTLQYKHVYNIGPHKSRGAPSNGNDPLEQLEHDYQEPNVWPETGNCTFDKGFKKTFQAGMEIRRNIGMSFIRSIARATKYPKLPTLFADDEFSGMALRKYPVRKMINSNMYSDFDGTLLRELEHIDSTVTVLSTFNNGGLEALYKNQYSAVPVTGDNSFMVNIGKLINDLLDKEVPALRHRVTELDYARYSATYFLGPLFHADISRSMNGKLTEVGQKYTFFGDWVKDYLGAIERHVLLF